MGNDGEFYLRIDREYIIVRFILQSLRTNIHPTQQSTHFLRCRKHEIEAIPHHFPCQPRRRKRSRILIEQQFLLTKTIEALQYPQERNANRRENFQRNFHPNRKGNFYPNRKGNFHPNRTGNFTANGKRSSRKQSSLIIRRRLFESNQQYVPIGDIESNIRHLHKSV